MGIHSNTVSNRFFDERILVTNMYVFAITAAIKIGTKTILYSTNPKNYFVKRSYPNIAAVLYDINLYNFNPNTNKFKFCHTKIT